MFNTYLKERGIVGINARNLDYIFELSEPESSSTEPLLKHNMIVANVEEASNGGFFMLRPSMVDWAVLQHEIRRKEETALELPWPHWDPIEGKNTLTRLICLEKHTQC